VRYIVLENCSQTSKTRR